MHAILKCVKSALALPYIATIFLIISGVIGSFLIPFSDVYVAMYLMHLANKGKSVSTLNKVYYDICWTHKVAGVADPCKSDLVMSMNVLTNTQINK
jgi:hypothetical protein